MTTRSVALLTLPLSALLTALLTAGCGVAERAKENVRSIDDGSSVNCVHERQLFQMAMESYLLLENQDLAVEAQMVPNYLRRESPLWDIDATGAIVAQPGGGCE